MLRVISDILDALDRCDLAALSLLVLSAAFDTVDYKTLIRRLETIRHSLHCSRLVLDMNNVGLRKYVGLRCKGHSSNPSVLLCWVPQGSVLGPILFILYTVAYVAAPINTEQ